MNNNSIITYIFYLYYGLNKDVIMKKTRINEGEHLGRGKAT